MGVFGTGISSSDTYLDVYDEFFKRYNRGEEPDQVSFALQRSYAEVVHGDASPDGHSFWFALAQAQWECCSLDPEVFDQVKLIIQSGRDLVFWHPEDQSKRKIRLETFLAKLAQPATRARARRKTKPPIFKKGDCLAIRLANGNWGGVVILEALFDETEDQSWNLAAATRINQPEKPSIEDFRNADVLITNFQFDNDRQAIQQIEWVSPKNAAKVRKMAELVGRLEVNLDFDPSRNYTGYLPAGAWFQYAAEWVLLQYESEKQRPAYQHRKTIRELTENEKWTYW